METDRYQHYGWPVSPYSAKTRAYLRFKAIPFDDVEPTAWQLFFTIRRQVGQAIMPTVLCPDGTWLQDSSAIIDALEARFPEPSIVPEGPCQRIGALLLELHADEWLPIIAMHYRWNVPENARFAREAFARYGMPRLPDGMARLLTGPIAKKMAGYRPILGITEATIPGIEAYTETLIGRLETHLAQQDFLFGGRPSIADFAMYGPLWAHLYCDPGSTHLFDRAPHVVKWFERLINPPTHTGDFLPDDRVPMTLDPILGGFFTEHMVWLRILVKKINAWCAENPEATRVPRSLGPHNFMIGGRGGQRKLATFAQWKAQRPLEAHRALTGSDRARVDGWLGRLGAIHGLRLQVKHPFERRRFKVRLAQTPKAVDKS